MSQPTLEILWYLVFVVVVIAYTVLDGFDLGVGAVHLFARKDIDRRIFLNAIGPIWDGNEVWLVVLVGALFAGFPAVYATLLSAFYLPVLILLAGLIFRAVAIEFRSQTPHPLWRSIWDGVFALGSIVASLSLGFFLGNLVRGIPLDVHHDFVGDLAGLFNPYAILTSFTVLALFAMHGTIFLVGKTEGELHERLRHWVNRAIVVFVSFYVALTVVTLVSQNHMVASLVGHPWVWVVAALNLLAIGAIPLLLKHRHDRLGFLASCFAILCLFVLYALGSFPNVIRSGIDPAAHSLTISNSFASKKTLQILLIIVLIGIPAALAYIGSVYYLFRGKVKLDSASY
ncbi:MAG: cytochrome d ubiquinol oxidase subunit II [Parachlamydiales bacterium]